MRNIAVVGSFLWFMVLSVARFGVRVAVVPLLALAVGLISIDDAGARSGSKVHSLVQSGELYVSPTDEALSPVAVSDETVVAVAPASGAAYVFDEPASGWSTESQVAKLVAPDPLAVSVAISGSTIVVGAPDATVGANRGEGAVYVFEEPPGGWSGTLSPSAKLVPSDGVRYQQFGLTLAISGSTVVVGADGPHSSAGGSAVPPAGAAYVFAEPPGGWSGTVHEAARLVPSGGGALWQEPSIAISGHTVVANGHTGTHAVEYLFTEPSTGWAGTVAQSGRLVTSAGEPVGPVQIAGGSIFATGSSSSPCTCSANLIFVFRAPPPGWTGTEQQSATLRFNSPPPDGLWMAASGPTAAVVTESGCPRYQNECGGSMWAFTEPPGGWSGEVLSTPAGSISSSNGVGLALAGKTAFFAHGSDNDYRYGGVSIYRLSGTSQFAPPTAPHVSLTGAARSVPRLQFKLTETPPAPAIKTITINLPGGLKFARNRSDLLRGISIDGHHRFTLRRTAGGIVLTPNAASQIAMVTVTSPALRETPSLLKRVGALAAYNRNKRHRRKKHLRIKLLLTTTDTQSFVVQMPVRIGVI